MPAYRFDRLLTMGLFRLRRQSGGIHPRECLPILMYHSISDTAEEDRPAYYRTVTRPEMFARQMEVLARQGREVCSLAAGMAKFQRDPAAAAKLAVLTFDDGFQDFHTAAFPILQRHGFGGTMFLPTSSIKRTRRKFKGRPCLTWAEARQMQEGGIEFGSHTVKHPQLHDLARAQVQVELEESKAILERELRAEVVSFAYPYAFPSSDSRFVRNFGEDLKRAGYAYSVTTRIGRVAPKDDPLTLRRLPVNSEDDETLFLAKLAGAYDWMSLPQTILKNWKSRFAAMRRVASWRQAATAQP